VIHQLLGLRGRHYPIVVLDRVLAPEQTREVASRRCVECLRVRIEQSQNGGVVRLPASQAGCESEHRIGRRNAGVDGHGPGPVPLLSRKSVLRQLQELTRP
jgi:hypothetical protein